MARLVLSLVLSGFLYTGAIAQITEGMVVKVTDGDTIRLLVGKNQLKVRLAEIDSPETDQPWGKRSRQALAGKISGKRVRVRWENKDRYGRIIGTVFLGERNINREMIGEGQAWVYRRYLQDKSLQLAEKKAKEAGSGLWSLPEGRRKAPWLWRKAAGKRVSGSMTARTSDNYSCGAKLYCGQMKSCAEARFYLTKCGLHRLDGDQDGIPCEKLCG